MSLGKLFLRDHILFDGKRYVVFVICTYQIERKGIAHAQGLPKYILMSIRV